MLCPILSSGLAGLRREISSSSTTLTVKIQNPRVKPGSQHWISAAGHYIMLQRGATVLQGRDKSALEKASLLRGITGNS